MISTGTLISSNQARPRSVLSAMKMPPMHMIGAATSSVQVISTSICTWVHVVGVAGDQGRGTELGDLPVGERPDLMEQRGPDVPAEAHGGAGAEIDGDDRADDLQHRDGQHDAAGRDDVTGVALGHALVDDVGVQRGQVQRGDRADQLEDDHGGQRAAVGTQVGAQQANQHHGAPTGCVRTRCRSGSVIESVVGSDRRKAVFSALSVRAPMPCSSRSTMSSVDSGCPSVIAGMRAGERDQPEQPGGLDRRHPEPVTMR